ncbi:uncharacterized protein LOC142160079 [Mixophyes fleayi]|uniref:uncharacterized protein LOC142160079 n=1 Tax=Mixophyes fleayi TaxID=3061075 RepID=UPI003F4E2E09
MAKCFVDRCTNYSRKKVDYGNTVMHVFPSSLEGIKVWLRHVEQSGQVIHNFNETAEKIFQMGRNDPFRICSEHFANQSYVLRGQKRTLKSDAVPTVFPSDPPLKPSCKKARMDYSAIPWVQPGPKHGQVKISIHDNVNQSANDSIDLTDNGPLHFPKCCQYVPANADLTKRANEYIKENLSDVKEEYKDGNKIIERLLNLTLEIIYLLTGEDYIVVKKTSGEHVAPSSHPCVSEGLSRTQSPVFQPHSMMHEKDNDQKILELTNKIIQLVTGEEGEYLEGHKGLYKDVMMENHQPLTSLDTLKNSQIGYTSINNMEESASCHGGNLTDTDIYTPTDHTQYTSIHIKEELVSCEGGNLTDSDIYTPTDHTQYTSTDIKEEPASCDGGNLTDSDIYTPTDHTQYTSTHIKEESVSCDGGNLTDTDIYIPTDHTQYTSTHIKEESVSCDGGNLTDTDIYTPSDHTQYTSTDIKEESVSCDGGNLTDSDIYTPTDHTQYTSTHIKEESVSCDRGNLTDSDIYTPTDHTQYTSTDIKEEPILCDGGNLTDTDIYTPTDHTQYTSTHIKEESVSCDGGNLTDSDIYTPTDHTQYTSTDIKEEPILCDGGNLTDTDNVTSAKDAVKSKISTAVIVENSKNTTIDANVSISGGKNIVRNIKKPFYRIHEKANFMVILYNCPDCDKSFTNNLDLVRHQIMHNREKWFQCSCSRGNLKDTTPTQYTSTHIKEESVSCDGGNLTDTDIYTPTDHTQHPSAHIEGKSVLCEKGILTDTDIVTSAKDSCKSKISTDFEVGDLENTNNNATSSQLGCKKPVENSNKPFYTIEERPDMMVILYNCPDCHEAFKSNLDLAKHQVNHSAKKRIKCSECGIRFCH